jgi:hypothetical protein
MFGRKMLSVYARDLKPGMVTKNNGRIVRIRETVPQFYRMRDVNGGPEGEALTVGIRYARSYGLHVLAPHDVVELVQL